MASRAGDVGRTASHETEWEPVHNTAVRATPSPPPGVTGWSRARAAGSQAERNHSMSTIGFGVIGCGGISNVHLTSGDDARIVCVSDINRRLLA